MNQAKAATNFRVTFKALSRVVISGVEVVFSAAFQVIYQHEQWYARDCHCCCQDTPSRESIARLAGFGALIVLSAFLVMPFRPQAFALFCVSGSCGLILIGELLSVLLCIGEAGLGAIVSLIAHVTVHPWTVGRAVTIRPAGLASTLHLADNTER